MAISLRNIKGKRPGAVNRSTFFRARLYAGAEPMIYSLICLSLLAAAVCFTASAPTTPPAKSAFADYQLDFTTPVDPALQSALEAIDQKLRAKYGMTPDQTSVGLLDLQHLRLAMTHPDRLESAASVAKVGILLAYFELHPEAATNISPEARHELGLMAKISSNEMA